MTSLIFSSNSRICFSNLEISFSNLLYSFRSLKLSFGFSVPTSTLFVVVDSLKAETEFELVLAPAFSLIWLLDDDDDNDDDDDDNDDDEDDDEDVLVVPAALDVLTVEVAVVAASLLSWASSLLYSR